MIPVIWIGFRTGKPLLYQDMLNHLMQVESGVEQVNVGQMREVLSAARKFLHAEWDRDPRAVIDFIKGG